MMHPLVIRPEAEYDVEEAYRWHEDHRPGLGSDFILCVEEGLAKILRDPEMYQVVHKKVRRLLIRRFPYGIFYVRDQNRVVVLAVAHVRRDPKQWESRT